jgi:hypothetical protein
MKTAVEWLINELHKKQNGDCSDLSYNKMFEQAKEMDKQQKIETWHNGYENQSPMIDEDNCGEQYYNETFKSK